MTDLSPAKVLVVGAGPVGLTLAAELARHGARVRIIEKADAPLMFCRALGVTPRTLEVFEDMGLALDLIDQGLWLKGTQVVMEGQLVKEITADFSDLNYSQLGVPQYSTEAVLAARLEQLGVTIERGAKLASLDMESDGVRVGIETAQGSETARFRFVVGCDGAHSAVRQALAIPFEGEAFPMEFMLGDVHIDWSLPRGMAMRAMKLIENSAPDLFVAIPLPERGRYRVSMLAPERLSLGASASGTSHGIQLDRPGATLADLQDVAERLLPWGAALSDMRWSSIFRISMRLADRYRSGNVFIAGDACHIHPPTGGQGMNTGIQDAYNLAWKLALVLRGLAEPELLDSYEAERRPVAADVVARTTEQSINLGREKSPPHRLQDTQLLVNYRSGPLSAGMQTADLAPGDRVPDVHGLHREGFGFPLRLFDALKGPQFVLLAQLARQHDLSRLEGCAAILNDLWPGAIRVVGVAAAEVADDQPYGVEVLRDPDGRFGTAFPQGQMWLIRPDKYIGLVADEISDKAVVSYLRDVIRLRQKQESR